MELHETKTWYVCHGPDTVHFVELDAGSALVSGQPNVEKFDTKAAAVARAEELGYVFEDED